MNIMYIIIYNVTHKYLISIDLGHMLKSLLATQKAVYVIFRHTGLSILMLELEVITNDTECIVDVNIGRVCSYLNQLMYKWPVPKTF
jgi:hypothetical protein